jgi:hypothetical protein
MHGELPLLAAANSVNHDLQPGGIRMSASGSKSLATIGFLTICEQTEGILLGGYLVLNTAGRPLEFHCTAPVRPSRAQEILYGPTLKPFLYGEQIGQTLVKKSTCKPLFVCTDVEPALSLREHSAVPVVLLRPADGRLDGNAKHQRLDGAHSDHPLAHFALGHHRAAVGQMHSKDQQHIQQRWQTQAEELDLLEPFTRIREAIEEAQRGTGRT